MANIGERKCLRGVLRSIKAPGPDDRGREVAKFEALDFHATRSLPTQARLVSPPGSKIPCRHDISTGSHYTGLIVLAPASSNLAAKQVLPLGLAACNLSTQP